jgi:RecA-family ATPase
VETEERAMMEIVRSEGPPKRRINDLRKQLRGGGYLPIPIVGKKPPMEQWQKLETNDGEIELWAKLYPYAKSTGLITRTMPTFDIDIKIPDAAAAIEDLVRARFEEHGTILVRFGNAPKRAIPFRTDVPFQKITAKLIAPDGDTEQKLELLCNGQQVVAFGIHETTQKPYTWFGGEPGEIRRDQLPSITEAEAQQLVEDAVELLVCEHGYQRAGSRPKKNGSNGTGNECAGADWGYLAENIRAGHELHDSLRDLAAKLVLSGMNPGAVVNFLYAAMDASSAPHDIRWQERRQDIPRLVKSAEAKLVIVEPGGEQAAEQPLAWLDMSNWDNELRPEREWAIRDRVPLKQVGLFSGEGGTGKSIIEMMKDVSHVVAKDWLGSMPEPGPAFYVGAEDDQREIHIRFHDIAAHYGVTFKQLIDGGLHVLPLLGQDATLCYASGKSGRVELTPLYRRLYEAAGDIKPINISIDTLSRAFAGSELDRVQVYAFAMHMQAMAMVAGGSVTVLSHPSLAGISSGSGISGSTAWHGAFRFRQYLTSARAEGGEQPDNNLRQFEFKKNQYGPIGEAIPLRYQRGLFLPENGPSSLDKLAREATVDDVFLTTAKKLEGRGQELSPAQTSHSYGPTIIARQPEAKGVRKVELAAALDRLLERGKLRIETLIPGTTREKKVIRVCCSS